MKKGTLFVVSGPSGCGKGTILAEVLKDPNLYYSVSATTRAPRPGEVDGVNYRFMTNEAFEKLIAEDGFLEYAGYCEHYYGSPKQPVEEHLAKGQNVILEIEVKGALQVRARFPEALSIFVMPPSFEELRRRLVGRGTETPEQIQARLLTARQEVAMAADYDYIIVNDRVEDAALRLDHIIKAAKCSKKFNQQFIKEVLENA